MGKPLNKREKQGNTAKKDLQKFYGSGIINIRDILTESLLPA